MSIKERIAISPDDKESIYNGFKEALSRSPTKILFDKARPFIILQKPEETDDLFIEEAEIFRTVRSNQIEELQSKDPYEFFFAASDLASKKGLFINYVLVNTVDELSGWFNHDLSNKQVFGYRVVPYEEIESGSLVVACSPMKIAEPFDVSFSMKGYMDVK